LKLLVIRGVVKCCRVCTAGGDSLKAWAFLLFW